MDVEDLERFPSMISVGLGLPSDDDVFGLFVF